jgi:hypothetical protein
MEKRNEINGLVMRFTNMIDTAGNKQEPHISYRLTQRIEMVILLFLDIYKHI